MRNLHDEFVYRKIKRPSLFLALPICAVFRMICKKRNVEFLYDKEFLDMQDKPMLYLCQHRSRFDYIYVFAGLKKLNVNILCGYQNIFNKWIYPLLKRLGVIAKMLYQPDVHATKQTLRAAKMGNSIMVFPEGIQSTSGSTHPINPATMKLLMKLKLPVALVTLKGAYFTRTRYSDDVKKGKITVHYSKLFEKEDFENYKSEELYQKLLTAFQYNEFEEHKNNKQAFIGKKENIYGLDNIIYKCPDCLEEFKFLVENDSMRCESCGFEISMDKYYDIHAKSGNLPFENIDEWYKWQRKEIGEDIKREDFLLAVKVKIGRINTHKLNNNGSIQYYGEGVLSLSNKALIFRGEADGKPVVINFNPKSVYSLSFSLFYDLDLYYENNYYNFKFLEKEKTVVKWMLAAEEIHNLYDKTWQEVSGEAYAKK